MTDVLELRCRIDGTDYGQAGEGLVLPGFQAQAGHIARIGSADLTLDGPAGYDAPILNQAFVELYWWDVAANRIPVRGRLFQGFVAARGTLQTPGTTEKVWHLACQDLNLLWETLVSKAAWAQAIHLAADTFDVQVAALFAAFNAGVATRGIDATAHVLNLTGSAVLPPQNFAGWALRDMLAALFRAARAVDPNLLPTATLTPDPDIGGVGDDTGGTPVLWVWDLASPQTPARSYTTGTPNYTTHWPILPARPPERRLESARFANWAQAQVPAGRVYTSNDTVSQGIYPPNPFDPDGVWKRAAIRDTQHTPATANATGTASVSGGAVTSVTVNLPGNSYPSAPKISFSGGGGTGARAIANLGGGLGTAILTDTGSGYTAATVSVTGGGGSGAAVDAHIADDGTVDRLLIRRRGSSYTTAPTLTISGDGTGATAEATINQTVLSVTILDGGTGYATAPTVLFSDPVQTALDESLLAASRPRETVPILVADPSLPGTYVGITLTVEADVSDTPYLVDTLTGDFTVPGRPLYTLECGERRLRLGEQAVSSLYADPSPPAAGSGSPGGGGGGTSGPAGEVVFYGDDGGLSSDAGLTFDVMATELAVTSPGINNGTLYSVATGNNGTAISAFASGDNGIAVYAQTNAAGGVGVVGGSAAADGRGVSGIASLGTAVQGATESGIALRGVVGELGTGLQIDGQSNYAGTALSVQIDGTPVLTLDGANRELTVTGPGTDTGTVYAIATAAGGFALIGETDGASGVSVYANAYGAGGVGVQSVVASSTGIAVVAIGDLGTSVQALPGSTGRGVHIDAPAGYSGEPILFEVNSAEVFAVGASGRPRFVSTPPSSASDTGTTGEIAWDSGFLYLCIATDTWVRAAVATW